MADFGAFSLVDYQPYTPPATPDAGNTGFWGTVGSFFKGILGNISTSGGSYGYPMGTNTSSRFDLMSILSPSTANALNKYNADGSVKTDFSGGLKLFGIAAVLGVFLYFITKKRKS